MKKHSNFRRLVSSALHYLIRDPKYLFTRVKQEFVDEGFLRNTIKPQSNYYEQQEKALPALVIDGDFDEYEQLITRFRSVFGEHSRIYRKVNVSYLAELDMGGNSSDPVMCSDIDSNVFFWPVSANIMPAPDHLLSAYLAIIENGVSISLISHDLVTGQSVTIGVLRDHMLFARSVAIDVFNDRLEKVPFTGKVLRLFPAHSSVEKKKLDELFSVPVNIDTEGFFENGAMGASAALPLVLNELNKQPKSKSVVFVFPIFLAVGGVERNTIEIIRQLRGSFDFIIFTMERLRPEQGSLSAQASEVAAAVIEMSEISRHTHYLTLLDKFKASLQPDLVWICNGSPWLCDNASKIRKLFIDTPIIDQEVYDEKRGWITRYNEAGIQSYDHFIAVNRKIQIRFERDFTIDPQRISLIYSAIDTSRILQFRSSDPDADLLREKFGLPCEKKIFTFIARLTRQKRPMLFLEIAESRLEKIDECYVLVGDGELASQSLDFIEKHNITNVVRIPYIENTLELHAISNGIIFTSEYEGLPIAMIEAISMGVPVFSTDVGDIADVLAEFEGGSVVSSASSPRQLIEAYDNWMMKRSEYAEHLKLNENKILERFSSKNISRQYESCWNKLIADYQKVSA